jgi:hypothetical protein
MRCDNTYSTQQWSNLYVNCLQIGLLHCRIYILIMLDNGMWNETSTVWCLLLMQFTPDDAPFIYHPVNFAVVLCTSSVVQRFSPLDVTILLLSLEYHSSERNC